MRELFDRVRNLYGYATAYNADPNLKHLQALRDHNLAEFDRMIAHVEAAAEQRGAEAALLCVDEPSWEHHDQTDGFPCTNCLNKAQKGIDRYRADRIANKENE